MTDLINGRTPGEIKRWIDSRTQCCTCPNEHETGCEYGERTEDCQMCIDALAYIEHLEAKQPKWISVKGRLPEVYGTYLTFIQCPKGNWIETNIYEHREERWEHDCGYHTEDVTNWITHWMPLPEPPKEEG